MGKRDLPCVVKDLLSSEVTYFFTWVFLWQMWEFSSEYLCTLVAVVARVGYF